jgi:hypothetical protein
MFSLVVDDSGIQYTNIPDAQHLLAVLKQHYEAITVDWTGSLFCGITLKWDYKRRIVDLSMPGYVNTALEEFDHPKPTKSEHQPHRHNPLQFGTKIQLTTPADNSKPLDNKGILCLQQITGKFLYYSRDVDSTMNVTLSTLASANQSHRTNLTRCEQVPKLLCHTSRSHPTVPRIRHDPKNTFRCLIQF